MTESRAMTAEAWIEAHASGTLRKNRRLGFAWRDQYRAERTAFEFGWGFECVPPTRICTGVPASEGDCRAATETGWHVDRLIARNPIAGDRYLARYVIVDEADGSRREGLGVVVEAEVPWLPEGWVIFAIVGEWNRAARRWGKVENPC